MTRLEAAAVQAPPFSRMPPSWPTASPMLPHLYLLSTAAAGPQTLLTWWCWHSAVRRPLVPRGPRIRLGEIHSLQGQAEGLYGRGHGAARWQRQPHHVRRHVSATTVTLGAEEGAGQNLEATD